MHNDSTTGYALQFNWIGPQGRRSTSQIKLLDRRHLCAVRMLGYVLTDGTPFAWQRLPAVLEAVLTTREKMALAQCVLRTLARHDADMVVQHALATGAGQPPAPLFSFLDEARFWVALADPEDLEAYALTIFEAMAPARQTAFLTYVTGRTAT